MSSKNLLIIFYRNPELGQVKTRLAKTIGDERALAIYLRLCAHTRSIAEEMSIDKVVYYSNFVDREDGWQNETFRKELQVGNDLGVKMKNAFSREFTHGYEKIIIIGTDCFELTLEIVQNGFDALLTCDTVIGPANDGGYYLLGMKKLIPELFVNKTWSSATVASDTISDLNKLAIGVQLLPRLSDVDEKKDLPPGF